MSKLYFFRSIGNHLTRFAEGYGTLSSFCEFNVIITWGFVRKGFVYEIRRGQSCYEGLYNCITGANRDGTANFRKATDAELLYMNEEYLGATLALYGALQASSKTVTININTDDLKELKSANYKLCFAKKVAEGDYNVVWQSYTEYLASNIFSWTPQYQLFGSNQFQDSFAVQVSTNPVVIALGEESTLDNAGVLGNPKTGGPETAITMNNEYGSIHPGLNQLSTGIDGGQVSTPIYVAPEAILKGEVSLTPVEKVLIWFEQEIQTSTMFSSARSMSVEIDLTYDNSATRSYQNQEWSTT